MNFAAMSLDSSEASAIARGRMTGIGGATLMPATASAVVAMSLGAPSVAGVAPDVGPALSRRTYLRRLKRLT